MHPTNTLTLLLAQVAYMHRKLGSHEALSRVMSFAPKECYGNLGWALFDNLLFQGWETLNGRTRLPPPLLPLLCDKLFLQQVIDTVSPWMLEPLQSVCFPERWVHTLDGAS